MTNFPISRIGIMSLTLRIRYGKNIGSSFYAQIHGAHFVITAKHLVPNLSSGERIAFRCGNDWDFFEVKALASCEHGNDVVAIRLREDSVRPTAIGQHQFEDNVIVGENILYCGFPLGMENEPLIGARDWPMPLLKAGMMSGSRKVGDDKVYLFDTLNNRGFSGGPIIRGEPESPSVIAVVCGYEFDAPLKIEQKNPCGTFEEVSDYRVRPNSGFMMGTPIRHAVNAAKRLL